MKKKSKINQPIIVIIFIALFWLVFNESGIIKWYALKNEQQILIESIDKLYNNEESIKKHIDKI